MITRQHKVSIVQICVAASIFVVIFVISHLNCISTSTRIVTIGLYAIPYLMVGWRVIWDAIKQIGRGFWLDENFLMTVASAGAFGLGEYPEAVAVMLFYQVGSLFENIAVHRSRESIAELMNISPEVAWVERCGELIEVPPEEVAIGEIVVVKPGTRVPLDGDVIAGNSNLDLSALTGESLPRLVKVGEPILSGCINLTHLLKIRTTKLFTESTVSKIIELVENASDRKANTERFISKFAKYYTPSVVSIALFLAVIPPLFFSQGWSDWIERALIFLVVSCPCALVISIPMGFFGGIAGAARRGVLIKGGNYLDALSKVKTVVFDKTGTLTKGKFEIVSIHPEEYSEENLLEISAYAESFSTHPISASILESYPKTIHKERMEDFEEVAGRGVSAKLDNLSVRVGNALWMQENGITIAECSETGTVVHISIDGQYAGHVHLADQLKCGAKRALVELKKLGIRKIIMLTGDKADVAEKMAHDAGLDGFVAELLPQDKVKEFEKLKSQENPKTSIAFVGDGINDAPVLALSDVGIAMGALGSDVAIEAADVVLMHDKLEELVSAVKIAKKTMRVVLSNIILALGVKGIVLFLAAFGIANMWMAVFADVGVAVIAILNAMRVLKLEHSSTISE